MNTQITYNKYPNYLEDMSVYTGKESYPEMYFRDELFD